MAKELVKHRIKRNIYDDQLDEWQKNANQMLVNETDETNVIIKCHGGELRAHKFVLINSSAYFRKLLGRYNRFPIRIQFPDIRKDIMQMLLDFMYLKRNVLSSDESDILEIYEAANELELNLLIKYSVLKLINNIHINNYLKIWRVAQKYTIKKLLKAIDKFLRENLEDIVENLQLKSFTKAEIDYLITKININNIEIEDNFIKAILDWAKYVNGREKYLGELYKSIKRIDLSWDCMNNLSSNEPLIFGNAEILLMFLKLSHNNHCICQNSQSFVPGNSKSKNENSESLSPPFKITKGMTSVSDDYFIYFIGGDKKYEISQGDNVQYEKGSTTVIKYFPKSETYRRLPPLIHPVFNPSLFIDNGILYVVGGNSRVSSTVQNYIQKCELSVLLKPCNGENIFINRPWTVVE